MEQWSQIVGVLYSRLYWCIVISVCWELSLQLFSLPLVGAWSVLPTRASFTSVDAGSVDRLDRPACDKPWNVSLKSNYRIEDEKVSDNITKFHVRLCACDYVSHVALQFCQEGLYFIVKKHAQFRCQTAGHSSTSQRTSSIAIRCFGCSTKRSATS